MGLPLGAKNYISLI